MKKIVLFLCFSTTFLSISAQDLSLIQSFKIVIEGKNIKPIVEKNEDDTVTVIFKEDYITDIFSRYKIYSFNNTSTSSNQLKKSYMFECNSKGLVKDLMDSVKEGMSFYRNKFEIDSIDNDLKEFFKTEKEYEYISHKISIGADCDWCVRTLVPKEKKFNIKIRYDESDDGVLLSNSSSIPSGINFYYKFKKIKSSEENRLELWQTSLNQRSLVIDGQAEENSEYVFFQTLLHGFTGVKFQLNESEETLILRTYNAIFGENILEFSSKTLSNFKHSFDDFIRINKNPIQNTLQLSLKDNDAKIEFLSIYDVSGKLLINKEKNFLTTNTSNLSKGLYFLQIHLENNVVLRKKLLKN